MTVRGDAGPVCKKRRETVLPRPEKEGGESVESPEKRRQRLLKETRSLYRDHGGAPVVHPRYGAVCHGLYEGEGHDLPRGTFGVRFLLCCFLFTLFVTMDRREMKVLDVDSDRIEEVISRDVVLPDTEEWISRIF
ncbi:hypothetical protein [uncultured Merdimonas sp.]|uniref:hypothetical protein n=1 Tax=uncultured Merdimonas sp. TaxID=2023269 RepID=UPI003207B0AC